VALRKAYADPAQDFARANALYQKGEFSQAARLYKELPSHPPDEPAYHYNLANALLKTGHTGAAVACYLRAFRLAPRHPDIRYTLAFALGRAGEDLVPAGLPATLFWLAFALSRQELLGLFWISVWACLVCWGIHMLDSRRRMAYAGALAGAAFACLFGGWLWLRTTLDPRDEAVTIRPDAEVRSGPGPLFSVAYTLPEGRRLSLISRKGEWWEILVPREGIKGWIHQDWLEKV